jgi:hypothetical protein
MEKSASTEFSGTNLVYFEPTVIPITLRVTLKVSIKKGDFNASRCEVNSIHTVNFFFRLMMMLNKRSGISGSIESLFNLQVGNSLSENLGGYEQLDFGFFVRKACFNLYSTDDPRMIDLIQSSRTRMGIDGDHDVIEIINEAKKIVEGTLFMAQRVNTGSGVLVPLEQ